MFAIRLAADESIRHGPFAGLFDILFTDVKIIKCLSTALSDQYALFYEC